MCGCMSVRVCLHVCGRVCGGQRLMSGVLSNSTSFYLLKQGLSLNLEFTDSASVTVQLAPRPPVSASQVLGLQWGGPTHTPAFYVSTCKATALFDEPAPQPRNTSSLSNCGRETFFVTTLDSKMCFFFFKGIQCLSLKGRLAVPWGHSLFFMFLKQRDCLAEHMCSHA